MQTHSSFIRKSFLDFFKSTGHAIVRSSPLIPGDPSLLFTNAGMVQFKDIFTGKQVSNDKRAASAQKCVRAGGKHNDLDNVGKTARHHTFFEMLGNFSFGDYFKEEAISFAWQLLHNEYKIPKERLWFTVFSGEDGIPADEEARKIWRKVAGIPEERIIGLGKKENFWMMGETGPQGPCSEIHFLQSETLPCEEESNGNNCLGPACDCDRFLEIWNLVFMQFEREKKDGPLTLLPKPSIDTGAGLERLTSVLQGKLSNYDTDLFQPLIDFVASACGFPYGRGHLEQDIAMRVLADHSRATAFLLADGVLPSNLGRGYVLRSILRRAIRYAIRLKLPEGFFSSLCLKVTNPEFLGDVYPELVGARSLIQKSVDSEDEGFRQTIHRGLKLIDESTDWKNINEQRVMSGTMAFQLHDTYGFPLDLTKVIGREQGFLVDEVAFEQEMNKQRNRSKFTGSGDQEFSEIYHQIRDQFGSTSFVGYERKQGDQDQGSIVALLLRDGLQVSKVQEGQEVEIITNKTPFYGRSGGQIGDTGFISKRDPSYPQFAQIQVLDTWKPLPDLIVHRGVVLKGEFQLNDSICLSVDAERRNVIRKNHSATHLLHYALRKILGEHVTQKGSYVGPDKLTFDFSHFSPLSMDERQLIEQWVNQKIQQNEIQEVVETDFEQARKLGAMALFGEKYSEKVRVMKLGESVELCGGTHVWQTGDIGFFKIIAETGIAKGIRRIEALTGPEAIKWVWNLERNTSQISHLFRVDFKEVLPRIERLIEEGKQKDREVSGLKNKLLHQEDGGMSEERNIDGVVVLVKQVEEIDTKALRESAEMLREQKKLGVVVLGGAFQEKVSLVVVIQKELTQNERFHAGKLISKIAPLIGGKGGGRSEVAQAGGDRPSQLEFALRKVFAILEMKE